MGGGAKVSEISIGGLPLDTLAEMANEAAELAERDMVSAVGRAWDCGRYLLAAKQQVPHGQWMHWVRVNFDRELRTASRYMQLAGAFESRAAIAEAASIRQAMRMISQPEEVPADESEPELVEEIETQPEAEPEIEPQERPSIRKVSAESRKVSETDREPTPEVRPVVAAELVEEAEDMILYHKVGESYCLADADDVAVAALQLHEPLSLVRMAVLAVPRRDMVFAIDELQQAILWMQEEIEEAET